MYLNKAVKKKERVSVGSRGKNHIFRGKAVRKFKCLLSWFIGTQ